MRQIVRVVGFTLIVVIFVGVGLAVLAALLSGRPFYGKNYLMLDLGTYDSALVLLIALAAGILIALRWAARKMRGRSH